MYTKAEKKTLLSYLNKVKKSWDLSDEVVEVDYLEGSKDDIEGYLLNLYGVLSILFYIEEHKYVCGIRFCKDIPNEEVAVFMIDLAKILPPENIFLYDGFYYTISGEIVFGDEATSALKHERYSNAVESYLKEVNDPLFSMIPTGKTYRC